MFFLVCLLLHKLQCRSDTNIDVIHNIYILTQYFRHDLIICALFPIKRLQIEKQNRTNANANTEPILKYFSARDNMPSIVSQLNTTKLTVLYFYIYCTHGDNGF